MKKNIVTLPCFLVALLLTAMATEGFEALADEKVVKSRESTELSERKYDSLLPLSKEDHDFLREQEIFLSKYCSSIVQNKKEGRDLNIDTEKLSPILASCHKIISDIEQKHLIPDFACPVYDLKRDTQDKSGDHYLVSLSEFAGSCAAQYQTMRGVLWYDAELSYLSNDYASVWKTLLLIEKINNSLILTGTHSCIILSNTCSDIVAYSRRICRNGPPEMRQDVLDLLARTEKKLNIMVRELPTCAKNEAVFALPVFLELNDEEGFDDTVKLIAYLDSIAKTAPEYFDLKKGKIFNLDDSSFVEPTRPTLKWRISFLKIQVQFYRDHIARLVSIIDSVVDTPHAPSVPAHVLSGRQEKP